MIIVVAFDLGVNIIGAVPIMIHTFLGMFTGVDMTAVFTFAIDIIVAVKCRVILGIGHFAYIRTACFAPVIIDAGAGYGMVCVVNRSVFNSVPKHFPGFGYVLLGMGAGVDVTAGCANAVIVVIVVICIGYDSTFGMIESVAAVRAVIVIDSGICIVVIPVVTLNFDISAFAGGVPIGICVSMLTGALMAAETAFSVFVHVLFGHVGILDNSRLAYISGIFAAILADIADYQGAGHVVMDVIYRDIGRILPFV